MSEPEATHSQAGSTPPPVIATATRRVHGLSPHVRVMLARIRRSHTSNLTLRQISEELGRQGAYLGWLFRRETGRSFHDRLTTMRLRHAARRIRAGEKIDAVALLVGYRSKKNFYEQFRRQFGATPGTYRLGWRSRRGGGRAQAEPSTSQQDPE